PYPPQTCPLTLHDARPISKLALARHAGDEARHYQLLAEKVRALGVSLEGFDPLAPPSPVLAYLRTLDTAVERVAAALVAREAMGDRKSTRVDSSHVASSYA